VDTDDAVVVERDAVFLRFLEPEGRQLLHLLGVLFSEIVCLSAIHIGVEQLPAILVELADIDHGAL
jgi:hypothetical protein